MTTQPPARPDALIAEAREDARLKTAVKFGYAPLLLALADALEAANQALREADRLASVAHDAIWHESVQGLGGTGFEILHSNDDPASAQSAIWALHEIVRTALAEPKPE